jgi:hypothetical protein
MLSNTILRQCDAEKENDVEADLQRLDRLTEEEAKTTATQTLQLAYDLLKNIQVVMDGARGLPAGWPCCIDQCFFA